MQDRYLDADALPMQRRHAVLATARQTIGNVELYGQALFGDRQFDVAKPALYNSKTVVVPVTNPFYVDPIGTHQPVQVQYSFLNDLGPERMRGEARAIGLSGAASSASAAGRSMRTAPLAPSATARPATISSTAPG